MRTLRTMRIDGGVDGELWGYASDHRRHPWFYSSSLSSLSLHKIIFLSSSNQKSIHLSIHTTSNNQSKLHIKSYLLTGEAKYEYGQHFEGPLEGKNEDDDDEEDENDDDDEYDDDYGKALHIVKHSIVQ